MARPFNSNQRHTASSATPPFRLTIDGRVSMYAAGCSNLVEPLEHEVAGPGHVVERQVFEDEIERAVELG